MKNSKFKIQDEKLRNFKIFRPIRWMGAPQSSIFNSQKGFTLIELIIAVTIVSMIMAIILSGMRLSIRAWEAGEGRVEVYQTGRAVLERLSQEIKSIYPYRYEKEIIAEDKTEKVKKSVLAFKGEPDKLWFITLAGSVNTVLQGKGLREVLYYIEKEAGGEAAKLLYREDIIPPHSVFDEASNFLISTVMNTETENKENKEGAILAVSEKIAEIKFRYYLTRKEKMEDGKEEDIGGWAESFSGEDEIKEDEEAKKVEERDAGKKKRGKPILRAIEIKLSMYELNPDETINREKIISFSPLIVPINAGREIKAI